SGRRDRVDVFRTFPGAGTSPKMGHPYGSTGTRHRMSVAADNLAVLVVDVCDSTRLYHQIGDGAAHRLTAQCLACVSEVTSRNGGQVVKTTGDGAVTIFPTVEQALGAAASIQHSLRGG